MLYDRKGGDRIGRFTATCTILPKAKRLPADWGCSLDAILPDGQLYLRAFGKTAALFSGKKFEMAGRAATETPVATGRSSFPTRQTGTTSSTSSADGFPPRMSGS